MRQKSPTGHSTPVIQPDKRDKNPSPLRHRAYGLSPLSYRSIDEREYREAMLVFYELNSVMPIKNIFISQYDFAAQNY
jgi:hypothetical protein